jgi:hypothetical protein
LDIGRSVGSARTIGASADTIGAPPIMALDLNVVDSVIAGFVDRNPRKQPER